MNEKLQFRRKSYYCPKYSDQKYEKDIPTKSRNRASPNLDPRAKRKSNFFPAGPNNFTYSKKGMQ